VVSLPWRQISAIWGELFSVIGTTTNYVCVTRPRRFGKSVMANMIAAFFSRAGNARSIFDSLKIAQDPQ
jgi:hypothetical protein